MAPLIPMANLARQQAAHPELLKELGWVLDSGHATECVSDHQRVAREEVRLPSQPAKGQMSRFEWEVLTARPRVENQPWKEH